MNPICRELRERMADDGTEALSADAAALRHLEDCPDCRQAFDTLARLDEALGAMPAEDAPEPVVQKLLARVRSEAAAVDGEPGSRPSRSLSRAAVWAMATAASLLVAVGALLPSLMRERQAMHYSMPAGLEMRDGPPSTAMPMATAVPQRKLQEPPVLQSGTPEGARDRIDALGYVSSPEAHAQAGVKPGQDDGEKASKKDANEKGLAVPGDRQTEAVERDLLLPIPGAPDRGTLRVGGAIAVPEQLRRVEPVYPEGALREGVQGVVVLEIEIDVTGHVREARILRSLPPLDGAAVAAVKQWVYAPTLLEGRPVPVIMTVSVAFRLPPRGTTKPGSSGNPSADPARAFLEERGVTEGVSFQPARGYWANTYLPGDPLFRLLQSRLGAGDPSGLLVPAGLRLHDLARAPAQPFDPPHHAALALTLHADRRGLERSSRMLVQVGLNGSPRASGHRPPMDLAVLLDLRGGLSPETAGDLRALVLAFGRAKTMGDRFRLVVAGRPGGVVVGPDAFRHGPLAVALDRLLTGEVPDAGPALDLPAALAAALREVSRPDDRDTPLGGRAVVLATGQPLGSLAEPLADFAHQGALAGVTLSAVGISNGTPVAELDRLALAGQGRRYVLESRASAPRLVESELGAFGDVVARAVRLRIRLAPGVRLVEVVGSRRLDETQAARVREAEKSIDLRLASELSIESDRGEDEDGIQILIPAFNSGDAHVILLDVVGSGPGAIAEVSVRYKDLVFLRNGVARGSLALPAGAPAPGPLERNVLKNLLAFRLSETLTAAAAALDAGDSARAVAFVDTARTLRTGLLAGGPGLGGDPEITRDVALLDDYARVLGVGPAGRPQLRHLADSLRYAGRLKRLPRPAPLAAAFS